MIKYIKRSRLNPNKYTLIIIVSFIFIGYTLSGSSDQLSNYISLALFILWCCIAILSDSKSFLNLFNKKIVVFFMAYEIFFFCTMLLSPTLIYTIKQFLMSFILFSPILIFLYFFNVKQDKILKTLLLTTSVIWFFFTFKSILFLYQNPLAARILASDSKAFDNALIGGGYNLAYGCAILGVYIFDILLNGTCIKLKYRLFLVATVIIFAVCIFKTQSTITLIAFLLGIIISLIFKMIGFLQFKKSNKTNIKYLFTTAIVLITCWVIVFNYINIGLFIVNQTSRESSGVETRLHEVGEKIIYGSDLNTLNFDSRLRIPLKSLNTFIENPFIGVGYKSGYDYSTLNQSGIGNHGEWADALGILGLFGGIPYLLIYFYGVKTESFFTNGLLTHSWIITLIIMGSFNPFKTFQSHFALFFLIPLIGLLTNQLYNSKKDKMNIK